MEECSSNIGGKIRYYRHLRRMTQGELADAAGLFRGSVIRYENEQAPCTLDACNRIAAALNIDKYLLYDDYLNFIADNYGDKINNIRQKLGLTQHQFAPLVGVWPKTVQRWEKGKIIPGRDKVKAIIELSVNNIHVTAGI